MKKSVQVISTIIVLCVAFAALFTLVGCAKQDEYSWTVRGDDGDIRAYYSDNGKYGFVLNIEGKGKLPDYAAYKDAPWYVKNGRITEIRISEGITAIGANTFSGVRTDMVIVPKTVKTIGANAFGEDVTLCAYDEVSVAGQNKVLLYSEKAPSVDGVYWHLRDGKPVVWQTIKVLFIGNSFTFYSDIPSLFAKIAIGAGQSVDVDSVTQGAWTLTKFADEKDEKGKEVDDKLRANQYDIIVLQDQSTRPLDNNSGFVSGVKAMRDKIKATKTAKFICTRHGVTKKRLRQPKQQLSGWKHKYARLTRTSLRRFPRQACARSDRRSARFTPSTPTQPSTLTQLTCTIPTTSTRPTQVPTCPHAYTWQRCWVSTPARPHSTTDLYTVKNTQKPTTKNLTKAWQPSLSRLPTT